MKWNCRYWLVNVDASAAPSAASGTASATGRATGPQVTVLPTIDDIHLPSRFHRRPIDEKEIEYINVSLVVYLQPN